MQRVLILTNDKALEKIQGNVDIHTVNYYEFNQIINQMKDNDTLFLTYDNMISDFIVKMLDVDFDLEYKNLKIKKCDIVIGCHNDNDTTYTIFVKE